MNTRTNASTAWPELTKTRTSQDLAEEAGHLRSRVRNLHEDAGELHTRLSDLHARLNTEQLEEQTTARARASVQSMLEELAGMGFSWRDIARLAGVSVPALRKWRQGETATGENRRKLARVLAFCDYLSSACLVEEVASYMEMPLLQRAPVTILDLLANERYDLAADLATGHATAADVLARFDPDWRARYSSDFEVFTAGDGELSIRRRDGD